MIFSSKLDKLLSGKLKYNFRYHSNALTPDLILVYINGKPDKHYYAYAWIDAEQAHPESKLAKLHTIYKEKAK